MVRETTYVVQAFPKWGTMTMSLKCFSEWARFRLDSIESPVVVEQISAEVRR